MLLSTTISRKQSELRQELAGLAGKESPEQAELDRMSAIDKEYQNNEVRLRSALLSESTELEKARGELETRETKEWSSLLDHFEIRQAVLYQTEKNYQLSGETAEVISELHSRAKAANQNIRGVMIPLESLQIRAGETVASGTPTPKFVAPIIQRLFPQSVAALVGSELINVTSGFYEIPVTTSTISAGWSATEIGNVAGPTQFTAAPVTTLKPTHNLGIQTKLTRQSMLQTGSDLENAVRRDMNACISAALDLAIFLGTGATGQPLGIITGQSTYGYTTTAEASAPPTYGLFVDAINVFLLASAATSFDQVKLLIRPEIWKKMDRALISGAFVSEWNRLTQLLGGSDNSLPDNIVLTPNALAPPAAGLVTSLLTTNIGGVAPIYTAIWGGVDLLVNPYTGAQAGILELDAMITADVTIGRQQQIQSLTGILIT
jgi:HK97 family phage major capsid protein